MHSYKFLYLKKLHSLNLIQIKQAWCQSIPYELLYLMPSIEIFVVSMVTKLQYFLTNFSQNKCLFIAK